MTARWAAVVVNYEAGPLLRACVEALRADDSAGAVELVVVDNGSTDGSVRALGEAHPDVQVVTAPGNVGYARAANLGIAATRAPFIAVINPDATVAPGAAAAVVGRMESDARIGACGPRILNVDGSVYPSARTVPSVPLAVAHGFFGLWWPTNPFTARYRQLDADSSVSRDVDWVSGAAVWLRRDALDDVGSWDERYFMYLEDVDLCWRMRRAGWRVVYEPAAEVVHEQGVFTARTPYKMLLEHHRSAWKFARRRFVGARVVLLPFAALYLSFRCAASMAAHALGAPGNARTRG
jgi:N-acetylglucosaminyl-diphospho-decaprenol L-rhamnosyltransferase